MITEEVAEIIHDTFGQEVPYELWQIFDELDELINVANDGVGHLFSTEIISLVILLWNRGILK